MINTQFDDFYVIESNIQNLLKLLNWHQTIQFDNKENMFQNRFDQLYLTICKQVGGIEGLLKSFFDFMVRKTDFFYQCDPGDKMGFPPGYNTKLLLGTFEQFQQQHYKRIPKKSIEQFNKKLQVYKKKQQQKQKASKAKPKQIQSASKAQQTQIVQRKRDADEQSLAMKQKQKPQEPIKMESASTSQANTELISTYNGGKNQKYSWSQQIRQIQVTLQLNPQLKAKQLKVKLQSKFLSVKDKDGNTVIQGQLYEKINAADSFWKVQTTKGKNYLNLNLQKAQQRIWSTVFVGDPEIDTTKVNNSKNLKDFDEETQGAIRKIMYEQQRKMQGLPTTDQQKQNEALKKAWDAQGSPFKGTPFDPSKLNLSGFQP